MMTPAAALAFYSHHSPFTDPGWYGPILANLPTDLPGLVRAIQGLIIPPYAYTLAPHGLELDDIEDAGFGIRRMEDLIAKLLDISSGPLNQPRPPRQRLGVNCRNFATLLVALLRQRGIPARERVGFAGYLGGAIHYEHRITEYWEKMRGRWVRVDAFLGLRQRGSLSIQFDTLDIKPEDPFFSSADVWTRARRGEVDPARFGDSDTEVGLPLIRYAMLHDFDALNKFEVLGDDVWGALIEKPEAHLTAEDLAFLDEVARLTLKPDVNFADMTALHTMSDYGKQVRAIASAMGL